MPRNSNIEGVAKTVIKQLKNGERPNVGKAMREVGYSQTTSESKTSTIKRNPLYIKTFESLSKRLGGVIDIGLDVIEKKKATATFRDGVETVDKMTKLQRLIDGQSTENVAVSVSNVLDLLENPKDDTKEDTQTTV